MNAVPRYIFALVLTAMVFLIGIGVGEYMASKGLAKITFEQQDLSINTLAISLQSQLLEQGICDVDIYDITASKFELGRRIDVLEDQKGAADPEVMRLKNAYSLLTLQQYLLVKQQQKECESAIKPILFFYDNVNEKSDSRTQGYILNYVYQSNQRTVAVFAFSINVNNPAVDTLKAKYKIRDAPTLVIRSETYEGILTNDEIEEALGLS